MDFILDRRSVRKYDLSKSIPYDTLKELCRYGFAAPSARNQASREFIIVDDKDKINKLSSICKGTMILSECNQLIAVVARDIDLPTPDMISSDLAAATENILLASTSMGIGSCWIGIYPREDRIKACNEILNVNDNHYIFSLIALGYPLDDKAFYDKDKYDEKLIHHNGM